MKFRRFSAFFLALLLAVLCVLPVGAVAEGCTQETNVTTILFTHDLHSHFLPQSTAEGGESGGYARLKTVIDGERAMNPDALLVDGGDFSIGSLIQTLYTTQAAELRTMGAMGYDAVTIGNHEFDFGIDNMVRLFKMAKFPIVCSNYDFTGTELADIVKPYAIINRKGLKIGVFGLGPELAGLVIEKNYGCIKYLDPIEKAREMTEILKNKEKCDVIICISHLGWKIDGIDDSEVAPATRNIDLILGGHSHTYFKQLEYLNNLDGKPVPVDQNGKNAIWVGKMTLDIVKNK